MKCPKCHADNPDTSRYCGSCATQLIPSGQPSASRLTKTLESPAFALSQGSLIAGKFRIIDEIGRGGMGIVYKAEDLTLNRTVALKFQPPEWSASPEARKRFVQEARAAAALSHPNICTIYEVSEAEDRPFIAMEYIEGKDLREKIKNGPLPIAEALEIAIQAAEGLEKAHQKGVVHRDIKSANIMVTDSGQVKIMDFGLAKLRGGGGFTKEGMTLGTVAYMSPEQARGEEVDRRTDLWSLGVVLYQSLAGHMPFPGEHDQIMLHSILHQAPLPLKNLRSDISAAVEHIVSRALEKKREARYPSAGEMLRDLRAAKEDFEAGTSEAALSWPRTWLKRRVPQTLGLYIFVSLGILQLVKWLANRFVLSPHLPAFSLAALLFMTPTVLIMAYFHGRQGQGRWAKAKKIGIPVNLLASAVVLVFLFYGKSLGAATTTVTLKNENGQTVERVIPRSEFRKSLALFFFENKTGDPSQGWLQSAIPILLELDLLQDLFVRAETGFDFSQTIKAAGFPEGVGLPLTLENKIARDRHLKYYVSGSFSKAGEELLVETSLHETQRATEVARGEFRGRDIFELTDQLSLKIRRDLGIPEQHIMDAKDLPVSEIGTTSVRALKSFIDGAKAITFESNFDKGLRCLEQSVTEDPTFAYGHEAIQLIAFYMNQREKREQAFKSLMQYLYKLPERVQYFIKASYYSFREDKEKQIAVLKMMVGLNPEETEGHRQLAEIYSGRNQWAEALSEFRRILEIDPGQKEALLRIGSLYEQEGEPKEALKYYEKYAAQYPEEVKSFTTIGDLYRTTGDFERAKSYYKKALLIEPENLPVLITMADIDADLGNFEGSEKICQDALKNANTPEDRARIFGSLASLFKTQGRYRRALEYVRLLMDEENKSQPALGALLNKITHLEAFIRAGKKDEAFQRVEEFRSQAAAPFNELNPFGYLFYYVEVEDAEKATQALKEAEATPLGPNTEGNKPGIIYFKGRVHEMKGEYEQAIAAYREYLKARPADLSINMFIGRSYRKLREFKKAEDSMQKCLKTSPYDPDLHYELALLYIDTKDKTKALEHLNVALNIWKNADPGIREVEDARMRLASLTGS